MVDTCRMIRGIVRFICNPRRVRKKIGKIHTPDFFLSGAKPFKQRISHERGVAVIYVIERWS